MLFLNIKSSKNLVLISASHQQTTSTIVLDFVHIEAHLVILLKVLAYICMYIHFDYNIYSFKSQAICCSLMIVKNLFKILG